MEQMHTIYQPKTFDLEAGTSHDEHHKVVLGGRLIATFTEESEAIRLRDGWNEHDTLKATAKLLDETMEYFSDNCRECELESFEKHGEHGKEGCKSCWAGTLLRKAKALR